MIWQILSLFPILSTISSCAILNAKVTSPERGRLRFVPSSKRDDIWLDLPTAIINHKFDSEKIRLERIWTAVKLNNLEQLTEALEDNERYFFSVFKKYYQGLFIMACSESKSEIVQLLLLDPWFDPREIKCGALLAAIEAENVPVVKILLSDIRIDAAAFNNAPLRKAKLVGNQEILDMLMAEPSVKWGLGNHK